MRVVSSLGSVSRASAARVSAGSEVASPIASITGPPDPVPTTSLPPRGNASPATSSIAQASFCSHQRQRTRRLAVVASCDGSGEILGREKVRRRARQTAAAETIGEAEELQARVRLARAVADQRHSLADEIGIVLAEQLGAVGDRRDRAYQVMAEPRREQLNDAQGGCDRHDFNLAWCLPGSNQRR